MSDVEMSGSATIQAVVRTSYGGPGVLSVAQVDVPPVGPHDVLVAVAASAVNPADLFSVTGRPAVGRLATGLVRPRREVPGRAFSGTVAEVGASVTRFAPGDDVYAEGSAGAYAEYVVAPEKILARKPDALSFEAAAAVPLAGVTALQGLRGKARLKSGQRVLVNGASGGVGILAIQIAQGFGAEVVGVARGAKVEAVAAQGVETIDALTHDFTEDAGRYDVILDLIGNHPLRRLRECLTPHGTLVLSSGPPSPTIRRLLRAAVVSPFVGQRLVSLLQVTSAADLEELARLTDEGHVRPVISAAYPFAEAAKAFEHYLAGSGVGRIVLVPGAD